MKFPIQQEEGRPRNAGQGPCLASTRPSPPPPFRTIRRHDDDDPPPIVRRGQARARAHRHRHQFELHLHTPDIAPRDRPTSCIGGIRLDRIPLVYDRFVNRPPPRIATLRIEGYRERHRVLARGDVRGILVPRTGISFLPRRYDGGREGEGSHADDDAGDGGGDMGGGRTRASSSSTIPRISSRSWPS